MALEKGGTAPDFTLYARPGEQVTMSEYRGDGKLVLLFFPAAYSGVCDEEMCAVAEDYEAYTDLGAKVLAVSADSPFVAARFAKDTNATFPILGDPHREVIEAYGVTRENLAGMPVPVSERAVFVIDGDGRIAYTWVGENPGKLPPYEEVKKAVEAA